MPSCVNQIKAGAALLQGQCRKTYNYVCNLMSQVRPDAAENNPPPVFPAPLCSNSRPCQKKGATALRKQRYKSDPTKAVMDIPYGGK